MHYLISSIYIVIISDIVYDHPIRSP